MAVIEVERLRKEYPRLRGRTTVAVDALDLEVPEGGVFGFLGPNGSGKTTTIRCLLGLARPTAGSCRMLDAPVPEGLAGVMGRVGSIVETPAFFPNFSGRRNLLLLARLHGMGKSQVDDVLERVGLGARGRDPVKAYSLGMRQRLGLAAALLKDPALLILDEPANGLDPAGIKEIRELLRRLGDEGRTVFVSSHILSEVQQVCDRVAILSRGRCVAAGPVREVLSAGRTTGLVVRLADAPAGVAALHAAGLATTVQPDGSLLVDLPAVEGARVTQVLADAGLYLSELRPEEIDLETVFLELTGQADAPPSPPSPGPTP